MERKCGGKEGTMGEKEHSSDELRSDVLCLGV